LLICVMLRCGIFIVMSRFDMVRYDGLVVKLLLVCRFSL